MRENSAWSLLTLSVGFMLAILGLTDGWLWLQPFLLVAAAFCLFLSIVCFGWPLRNKDNRTRCVQFCKHPFKIAKMIEPSHIIILGLLIALAGAIWHWRREPPPEPRIAALQAQIESMKVELAGVHTFRQPTTRLAQVDANDIAQKPHPRSSYDIGKRQEAVDRISYFINQEIIPIRNEGAQLLLNWEKELKEMGPTKLADKLEDYSNRHIAIMKKYKEIFKDYDTMSGMLKLETDLGLIFTSQTEKFARTLRGMPSTVAPETLAMMKDSQMIKDLMYEYQILSGWVQKAKETLRQRREEWSQ
jgi:hypothetical protein